MVSLTSRKRGKTSRFRVMFRFGGRLKEISLPKNITRKAAGEIARHIEQLISHKLANISPPVATATWAAGTKGTLRRRLISLELLGGADAASSEPLSLQSVCESYIRSRKDWKSTTKANYNRTLSLLSEHLKASTPVNTLTPASGDRWKSWLLSRPMAPASVSKHVKRAKTMLSSAVRDKRLTINPFASVTAGRDTNPNRQAYISQQVAAQILKQCPDVQWRCIFSLARFAGLRCPTEILGLTWADIDWDAGRIRIDSVKTGLRQCPLFPELRTLLTEAMECAEDGTTQIITRYRQGSNLGTQLRRIILRGGITPWPKLFNNLRASCRTDLQECYPDHVINAWLGHSTKTAAAHYLQVTPDHWTKAAQKMPNELPNINSAQKQRRSNHASRKPTKNP